MPVVSISIVAKLSNAESTNIDAEEIENVRNF
jgi:hypothetical protein